MDWRTVKFDWNRARAFLVTAEEGSLSAAARALGLAQPTLGRQVSALEDELGVALFERSGRDLILTPSGLDLLEHVRAMGEAASSVSLAASGRTQSIAGNICISASEVFSVFLLPPIITRLRQRAPGITVDVVASNSVSDLRRREADIAIRNGQPTDPELYARKVRDEEAALYATPDYIASIAPIAAAHDLQRAAFVGFEDNGQYIDALNAIGLEVTADQFPLRSASHLVYWELAVERVAPWLTPFRFPVWLVTHREVKTSRRVRLVFDLLADELAAL
jgi:DNA-binding transcriptional LysR family regulator